MHVMKVGILALTFAMAACGGGVDGAKTYYCSGFVQMAADGGGFDVVHIIYDFPDNSVMTTCEVEGGYDMASSFRLWHARDRGAEIAACAVTFDIDDSSSGWWELAVDEERTSTKVAYRDTSSVKDGRVATLPCAER